MVWRGGNQQLLAFVMTLLVAGAVVHAQPVRPEKFSRNHSVAINPQEEPGWTALVPSGDSRIVYVSSSNGSDGNSGLSSLSPKATLAAAYELMRDGQPDWMVLKRGDVWWEAFPEWTKGGRSSEEPMVIASYGTGARPRLNTGSGRGFWAIAYPEPKGHIALMDIYFIADRSDGTSLDSGVTFLNNWTDILIENCKIEDYRNNIVVEQLDMRPSNIRVRRCIIVDSFCTIGLFSQGIYTGAVDGLLVEENVFDHNGWRRGVPGASAIIFNHNMYLHDSCTGVTTRGNISARASATGISQRCAGICEDNLLIQNPTSVFFGGEEPKVTARGALRNNVVFDSRDIDSLAPRGFGLWIGGLRNVEVYGNIIAHHKSGSDNVVAINLSSDNHGLFLHHNLIYDWTLGWTGLGMSLDLTYTHGAMVTDNVIVQPTEGLIIGYVPYTGGETGRVFGRNQYYSGNPLEHQFYYGMTYPDWVAFSDDVYSTFANPSFPDPNRDIAAYMSSLQLDPSIDSFLAMARQQERDSWDPRFTAASVAAFVRAGFNVQKRGCRADFNNDGQVDALDLVAFQAAVASQSPSADIDLDGGITTRDIALFQSLVTAGCP